MRYTKNSKCSTENDSKVLEEYVAGENISALKVVYVDSDGKIYIANNELETDVLSVIGVSFNSANIEGSVDVLLFGELEDNSFSFQPGEDLFLNNTGGFSNTPPSGNIVFIAKVITPSKIFVNLNEEVILRG